MSHIYIHSTGAVSAIGLNPPVMAAAAMAGISMVKEYDYRSSTGEPFRMALIPDECLPILRDDVTQQSNYRYRRMLQLLQLALEQVELDFQSTTAVFINLPDNLQVDPKSLQIIQEVHRLTGQPVDWLSSRVYLKGRAGGYAALADAYQLLSEGRVQQALVIGVDSCLCPYLLGTWEKEERILLSHTGDGFIPGEAAGCMLLKLSPEAPAVQLGQPHISQESAHLYSDEVCYGKGLTEAFHEACEPIESPIRHIICGLNGESSSVKEWGLAVGRLDEAQLHDAAELTHPADCYGDIGAATAPVLIALANHMLLDGDVSGSILTWSASDYETRGAVVLWNHKSTQQSHVRTTE